MNNDNISEFSDDITVSLSEREFHELFSLRAVINCGASCDSDPPFYPHVTVDRKKYEEWKEEKLKEYVPAHPLARLVYELDKRGNKGRSTPLSCGEFIFDFNGDLVGVYLGKNIIDKCIKDEQ